MSQHDYVLDNQDGASFRQDINAVLQAIASLNSGATAPATPYAYMLWQDTAAGVIKQRNAGNTAWDTLVIAPPDGSVTPAKLSQPLTQGTSVATTSGTTKDFTTIPSWAKRVTILFNGISTNGTSIPIIQIGSGSFVTSGYNNAISVVSTTPTTTATQSTVGVPVATFAANTDTFSGSLVLTNFSGNSWVAAGTSMMIATRYATGTVCNAPITLSGALDRIRLTTVNGTDTFDAGSFNILYE